MDVLFDVKNRGINMVKKCKKVMFSVLASGVLVFGVQVPIASASLCAATTCQDVARNRQTGNANSSATNSWRQVRLRTRQSAASDGSATVRIQYRTTNMFGIHSWRNDGSRVLRSNNRTPDDRDSTLFSTANRRPFRARIEPSSSITATARVSRLTN